MDSKKYYKEKYKEAFVATRKIINEIDPTGFISRFGDETYNAEVSLILAKLQHAETEQEIKDIVIQVFSHYHYFDPSSLDSSLDLSAKLMEVKKIICP